MGPKTNIIIISMALWGVILFSLGFLIAYKQYLLSLCVVFLLLVLSLYSMFSKKPPRYLRMKVIKLLDQNGGRLEYEKLVNYFTIKDISTKKESNKIVIGLIDSLIKDGKIQVKDGEVLKIT